MASNGVTIFSATKTDERIEKDMITEQSEKAWPCSKRCRVHQLKIKMNTNRILFCKVTFMGIHTIGV